MALWCFAVLLLIPGPAATATSVLNSLGCVPEPIRKDQAVRVFYTTSVVPSGCEARGPIEPDLEVHVLNLRYSRPQMATLQLNVSSGAVQGECKAVFVLNANSSFVLTIHSDEDCRLHVIHGPRSYVMPSRHNSTATVLPFSSEQLLTWAKETYGGVSSFAELEDPQQILFRVGREPSTSKDCILTQNFNAESYLEIEVLSHKVEICLDSHKASGNVAHILWLQQSPSDERMQTVELNIKTVCKDGRSEQKAELPMALWLKSHQNTLWKMGHGFSFVQLLASGKYSFATFSGVHNGTTLPDNKEELIQKARNNSFMTSYTEIPSAKSISLEYKRICGSAVVTTTPPPQTAENLTVKVHQLINLCKPWKCLDSSIEIALLKMYLTVLPTRVDAVTLKDPSCRARDNTTHFVLNSILDKCSTQLEGGVHVKNQLILTLPVSPGKVTVPFECDLPEKVSLQLYNSEDFNSPSNPVIQAHQVTYVEISLRTAMKQFSLEMEDCFLKPRDSPPQLFFHQGLSLSYSVETLKSPSPKTQRFSFTYKPEEELWSIDSATLVCVVHLNTSNDKRRSYEGSLEVMLKNYNPGSHNQGLRISTVLGIAFGAFLIGVLLTGALWFIYSHTRPIAKTQPALANAPASESSSTNHSLGSTQSTPCSTSSMA